MLADFTKYPHAWMVHLDDGRDALCRCEPKHGNWLRRGYWISIQCHYLEAVPRERNPMNLGRAAIEDVHHDALALFDFYWISRTEHLAVDCCHVVDRVHKTVVAAQELPVPVMESKKDLPIVSSRVVTRFDQQETVQPAVLRLGEVFPRERVRVVPAESCRSGGHGIARRGTWRDHWRAFLHCTVDIRRQVKAVPMNKLR